MLLLLLFLSSACQVFRTVSDFGFSLRLCFLFSGVLFFFVTLFLSFLVPELSVCIRMFVCA